MLASSLHSILLKIIFRFNKLACFLLKSGILPSRKTDNSERDDVLGKGDNHVKGRGKGA